MSVGEAELRGVGETLDDVLVEAQVLFGGSDSQPAVKAFADAQVELAGVAALGQRFGHRGRYHLQLAH